MNTPLFKLALILVLGAPVAIGADYVLWRKNFGAGGAASQGGQFQLIGTIGQSDVLASAGGSYRLAGGFWAFAAAMPGGESIPVLRISVSETTVTLNWPNPSTGFQLESSPSLSVPNWTDVDAAPSVVGDDKQVQVRLLRGPQFFRLRKP